MSDHTEYRNHGTNNLLKPIKNKFYKLLVRVRISGRPLFSSPERRYFVKKVIFFPFTKNMGDRSVMDENYQTKNRPKLAVQPYSESESPGEYKEFDDIVMAGCGVVWV
jgi:hypothetical protein